MEVPAIGALSGPGGVGRSGGQARRAVADRTSRALRSRWRTASLASGWRFPGDWAVPEVDEVCAAVAAGRCPDDSLGALAGARATAGAGLAETLADLAALHAVLGDSTPDGLIAPDVDATPPRLLRLGALGWAAVALEQLASGEVTDAVTGLATPAYLRARLAELYRGAARANRRAADQHTLLVVAADLAHLPRWTRLTAMFLVSDALQQVFDGGETLAALGPATVIVLAPRDSTLSSRAVRLRRELDGRLRTDGQLTEVDTPGMTLFGLPSTHTGACSLLDRLSRH